MNVLLPGYVTPGRSRVHLLTIDFLSIFYFRTPESIRSQEYVMPASVTLLADEGAPDSIEETTLAP